MTDFRQPYRFLVIALCALIVCYVLKMVAVGYINSPPFNNGYVFGAVWLLLALSLLAYHAGLGFLMRRLELSPVMLPLASFFGSLIFPPVALLSFVYIRKRTPRSVRPVMDDVA